MNFEHRWNLKQWVIFRDGNACTYCRDRFVHLWSTLDHVIPLSAGGSWDLGNLVLACRPCNSLKGSLTAREFRTFLSENPQKLQSVREKELSREDRYRWDPAWTAAETHPNNSSGAFYFSPALRPRRIRNVRFLRLPAQATARVTSRMRERADVDLGQGCLHSPLRPAGGVGGIET